MRGFVLKNVYLVKRNMNGDENIRGDILAIGYRYSHEKSMQCNSFNRGLVIFFKPEESTQWNYVKSFMLLPKERLNLMEHIDRQQTIVRDLGYILSFESPVQMQIIDLGSYASSEECSPNSLFSVSKVGICTFYLEMNAEREQKIERANQVQVHFGFNRLIQKALCADNESDSLCSSIIPEDLKIVYVE